MQKNDCFDLTITGITNEGNGVGRHEGMAVFVPSSAPGDLARVRAVKVLSRHAYGRIETLLCSSPARIDPGCAVFGRCGGCALRHIDYREELAVKQGWVEENLRRIGGLSIPVEPIIGSDDPDRYRNKAIYPITREEGHVHIGFYARRSHRLIGQTDCLMHPTIFSVLAGAAASWLEQQHVSIYDEQAHAGLARALFLRAGEATGEVMACLVVNGNSLPDEQRFVAALRHVCPDLRSVVLNSNTSRTNVMLGPHCRTLWGSDTITDRLCGLVFELSPLSFYQVNRRGAERLYGVAADYAALTEHETLLDLYCGAGTIGLTMADRAGRLFGIDVVPEAIGNAIDNAARNGVSNARFLCADAAEATKQLATDGVVHPVVILLDPPRKGCSAALLDEVVQMNPRRVVMVSCDSATAARDIKILSAAGYTATRARPIDLFPRTTHVETVIALDRG